MHFKSYGFSLALNIVTGFLFLTMGEAADLKSFTKSGPICPPHGLFADCACNNSGHSSLSPGDSVTLFMLRQFLTQNASGCVIPVSVRTCAMVTGECASGIYVTGGLKFKIYGWTANPSWAYNQEITGTAQ
jgi:hypothetical protein